MSNVQSYNALIDRFKAFASGHFILKSFSHGQIDTADLEKFTEYPFMHVVPSNVTYAKGTKTFSFQIVLADLPRDKDDKVEFQREVLSDLQRIAEDLVAEITNHRVLFGDLITVQNVSLEPFLEEFHNTLTGWTVSLELLVPYYWDACSIPAEWNDMFESGSGGTGSILTFVDSITRDEYGNVSLVNDEATPAPNYYYGTNDEGVRGWYLLTDEVGLTCATIGTCQTIIDIESAIDDLQTEIALKANTADLGAVAFSNDYNDLDNLPNLSGYGDMFKSVYDTDVDGVVDSAERIQIVVRNSTGSTLTKGQIVYLSGATGNRPNAVLAQANTEMTSSKTIGMVIADIANNADGQVAVNGTLHDLDTSAFTAGDTLWLSATTAGGMVANTPPSEPNHAVFIGYVARSHPNLGRIVLAIQNGYELDELHGVLITTPANNEVLTYESSTSLWKNKTVETALGYTPVPTTRTLTINGTTQDLSADRTFTIATNSGTVTSVAALTLGTTGTDLSSTVATGTTTPVITLNVPTASATNRGVLSSTDWSTFNSKFTLPSLTSGSVLFSNGTTIAQSNANFFWDNTNSRLGIGTATPALILDVRSAAGVTADARLFSDTNQFFTLSLSTSSLNGIRLYNNTNPFALGNDAGIQASNKRLSLGTISANDLCLATNAASRILINGTTGNVLINTTTDAGYKLDVNGTARVQGVLTTTADAVVNGVNIGIGGGSISTNLRFGAGALLSNTTGSSNTALGFSSLIANTSGVQNTSVGRNALVANTTGSNNTAIGHTALVNISSGSGNTALGALSGRFITDGTTPNTITNNSVFLGVDTRALANNQTNQIVIGYQAIGLGSNTTVLGNTSTTLTALYGAVITGGTSVNASAQLQVDSTTRGFLPPRMTTTQKNAIASPVAGLMVYDTTLNLMSVYNGTMWISL